MIIEGVNFVRQVARELAAYFASSEYCKTKTELLSWKKKIRGLQTMNARHYGESCRKLKEIGVMLGELIEEVKTRK